MNLPGFGEIKANRRYYVEANGRSFFGKLQPKRVQYKGVIYAAFVCDWGIALVDPDDIEEITEVKALW